MGELALLAGSLGGALAVGGLTALVTGAIDAADKLRDLSQATGITVESLGGLGFAASQNGGSLEGVAAAAGKLNKTLAEAAAGSKEALEPFTALGISTQTLRHWRLFVLFRQRFIVAFSWKNGFGCPL